MLRRYILACLAALLVTAAVLLVMTHLILPVGGDPAVTRMLLELEFRRSSPPEVESGIRVFERPPEREVQDTPDKPEAERERSGRPERSEYAAAGNEEPIEAAHERSINWWAEARAVIEDLENEDYGFAPHGRGKYVSIMQGPMPGSGDPITPSSQDQARSGYTSVYGDLEVAIGENCVMQMRSKPFDYSDFARNIPPLIVCKGAPETDLSRLGENRERNME